MSGKFRHKETGLIGYLVTNRYIEHQIEDGNGIPINGSYKTLKELLKDWEELEDGDKGYKNVKEELRSYFEEIAKDYLETDDEYKKEYYRDVAYGLALARGIVGRWIKDE